jgi:hypothetical protein
MGKGKAAWTAAGLVWRDSKRGMWVMESQDDYNNVIQSLTDKNGLLTDPVVRYTQVLEEKRLGVWIYPPLCIALSNIMVSLILSVSLTLPQCCHSIS